jgi:hypothetical protein
MTAHSPVGLEPEKYKVKKVSEEIGTFANNDIAHTDPTGANHELFGFGLKKALLNYMHGACFEMPLQKWFDFKTPKTTVPSDYIVNALADPEYIVANSNKVIWLGVMPKYSIVQKSKKGSKWEEMMLSFENNKTTIHISLDPAKGSWLLSLLPQLSILDESNKGNGMTLSAIKSHYTQAGLDGFELFWDNKPISSLHRVGLLCV